MSCCKKNNPPMDNCTGFGLDNTYFLILVLFILLAIIIGGIGY